jgi:hypothetical protein
MEPAFQSDGFKHRQSIIQNPKFDSLIATVEALNKAIAEDLRLAVASGLVTVISARSRSTMNGLRPSLNTN